MNLPTEIGIDEVKELVQSGSAPLILDVRDGDSFNSGHIPGAIWNDMSAFDMDKIPADVGEDDQVIVVCYMGHSSLAVVDYLRQNGYPNARSMKGGMGAWSRMQDAPLE